MASRRFAGRSVIVTGGSAGIGAAIVDAFLAEGASVSSLDIAPPPAGAPARAGLRHAAVDVSDEAAVEAAVAAAAAAQDGLDVLVNCAATFVYGTVEAASAAAWRRSLDTNVLGAAFLCRAALPHLRARGGGGAIVNISSISAFTGQTEFVPYAVSKAAILQLTRNVAADCGAHGIRVNSVSSGPILTEGTARHAAGLGRTLDEVKAELTSHLVLKRMGTPAEVAKAVLFLASDDASFITGTNLMVDGGYCIV